MLYSVLLENKRAADYVVLYPGRFQPFHYGHKSSYDHLVDQFGSDKVFIITAGFSKAVQSAQQKLKAAKLVHGTAGYSQLAKGHKEQLAKNPMGFDDKLEVMTGVHGIRHDHTPEDNDKLNVVHKSNPYQPFNNLTDIFGEDADFISTTKAVIVAIGEKDLTRLQNSAGSRSTLMQLTSPEQVNSLQVYHDPTPNNPKPDVVYYYFVPNVMDDQGAVRRGTDFRKDLRQAETKSTKLDIIKQHVSPDFDIHRHKDIFTKLTQQIGDA